MSEEKMKNYEEDLMEDIAEEEDAEEAELEDDGSFITLRTEDGQELTFEFLDTVSLSDREFVVLLPLEEDAEEAVILEVIDSPDDPDMEDYISVEDQTVLDEVFEIFKERNRDAFNFIDDGTEAE